MDSRPSFSLKPMGEDHPIAWTNQPKTGGRFFYTEFGHDMRSLSTPFVRQHILEARCKVHDGASVFSGNTRRAIAPTGIDQDCRASRLGRREIACIEGVSSAGVGF
jgi:hypothetical protein